MSEEAPFGRGRKQEAVEQRMLDGFFFVFQSMQTFLRVPYEGFRSRSVRYVPARLPSVPLPDPGICRPGLEPAACSNRADRHLAPPSIDGSAAKTKNERRLPHREAALHLQGSLAKVRVPQGFSIRPGAAR